jgi:hypothetical protein
MDSLSENPPQTELLFRATTPHQVLWTSFQPPELFLHPPAKLPSQTPIDVPGSRRWLETEA